MLKKIASVLTVLCLLAVVLASGFTASAEIVNKGKIEIDKVSAVTGDTVIVPIRITDNPGIMAITISITYNSTALTYEKMLYGDIVNDYTVVAHPDKNIIRFVNCESRNRTKTGVLVYLQFKVSDTAEADFYEMDIKYSAGDFCNWNLDKIMPEIVPGGVEVAFNGQNCSHKKYDDWTVAAKPSCEENGLDQRVCKTCGHIDLKETEPIGHEYSENWTIDQPATKEQDGIMTRYCIRCDDYVDRINFSLEQSEEGEIKNEINQDIPNNTFTEELFKEQNPGKELTQSKPAAQTGNNNTQSEEDRGQSDASSPSSSGSADKTDKNDKNTASDNESTEDDNASEKEENQFVDFIENIAPQTQTPDGESVSVIEKIAEVFPNFEGIVNTFKFAVIILIVLVL